MSSKKEEQKEQPIGELASVHKQPTKILLQDQQRASNSTLRNERQNSVSSLKASKQGSQISDSQKKAAKLAQANIQLPASQQVSRENQSGSKSTLISKQFSASPRQHSDSFKQQTTTQGDLQGSPAESTAAPAIPLRRTTRESKPSNRLQASKEGILLQAAARQSSTNQRKESIQGNQVGNSEHKVISKVKPPALALTIPTSTDSPAHDAIVQPQDEVTVKGLEPGAGDVNPWQTKNAASQKDMKTKEANSVNEEEKETPLDTLYERSQTKNSTKKSKKAKLKEDPEEDATVSDEDEEEEDSQEEDDDDDEDDDEDDEDADASVSMQQSGSMKKARVRRNKQKQTSRKLWSNQEDAAIVELVKEYGTKKWTFVANKLEEKFKIRTRTGKQCRERWHNHLDPYINKTPINKVEEKKIFDLHKKLGNKWADIAKELPGRSDNCIKNYFYSTHRKHQRRINKSLRNVQVGKALGFSKHLTAEELHKLVIQKKTTYEEIRRMEPIKFMDLEATMRMLYDHGNMKFDSSSQSLEVLHTTNASMREPKRLPVASKAKRNEKVAATVGVKRNKRPESLAVKQPPQAEKPEKRTKTESDQAGAARAAKARPAAASTQHASQKVKAAKPAAPEEENETMTLELEAVNERDLAEQGEDPYQNQQSTPVFVDKNDSFVGKLLDNEHVEQEQQRKRQKKGKAKESAAQRQAEGKVAESNPRDSPTQNMLPQITLSKQESTGKEKGFHKVPYTNQQPGTLQLGMQQSQGGSYKSMGLGLRGFQPQFGIVPPPHLGYMSRGYPMHMYHPPLGFPHHSIDPACLTKYELAWGADYDRLNKGQQPLKSGELPPATPDTSMMFKDMNMGRPFRNPMLYPAEKVFNLSMNSPMFIPFMDGASPRPPTTRQHFQAASTQPSAVNFTLNLNVNSDYRPGNQSTSTPQQQKPCSQCNLAQCQCHEQINLDKSSIFKTFQIDGQKSATQSMSQTKLINLRPSHAPTYNMMSSQPSIQDEQLFLPNSQRHSGMVSDKKSDLKQGSASMDARNKESFCLSALNSDNKPQQSFMTKLNQVMPQPLMKDMSFGGPQSSVGVISGLPSSSTLKHKPPEGVQFPSSVTSQQTQQQQIGLAKMVNRSVTPRPQNVVTPVTVGAQDIHTPKYQPPMTLQSVMAQDGPSGGMNEAEVASHKSHSQRSAFKPVSKKRSASKESATVAHLAPGVTKSNGLLSVTEQAEVTMQAQEPRGPGTSPNNSNYMTPDGKSDLQHQINNSQSAKDGAHSSGQKQPSQ